MLDVSRPAAPAAPRSDHASPELAEADRLMTICNACRYCEGLCAVFPAMERRRAFADADLRHLADLCHNCGACYHDCQYAPPHDFAVNVPRTLARLRPRAWQDHAWPAPLAGLFRRNGAWVGWIAALCVALFLAGFMAAADPGVMFGRVTGPGAFYAIMPHAAMAGLFGAVFLFALLAMALSLRNAWKDVETGQGPRVGRPDLSALRQGFSDAARLKNLDGGGLGCGGDAKTTRDARKHWHHAAAGGFLLCLAATCCATLMHYLLGWEAPYAWYSLPVILGTLGGLGITLGPLGLLRARRARDPALHDPDGGEGMDAAFLVMLAAVGATGLALLVLRATPVMGTLLALHLGFVFAFFLTLPYGRFMHGPHRLAALVREAMEARAPHSGDPS